MSDTALRDAELRPGLSLREAGGIGQITVRADLGDAGIAGALPEILGTAIPERLQARFASEDKACVWMSPDELLIVLPVHETSAAVARIGEALEGHHAMALDVSDARVLFRLEGVDAAETLAKGAPLDFSDAGFPVGCARRTHLGPLAVGIWRRETEVWEIVCFRSFAHHLFAWLAQSGRAGAEVGSI